MADSDYNRRNKKPRLLTEPEREKLDEFIDSIHYSSRYSDDENEYRHVQLPKQMLKAIPKEYFDPTKGTLKLLWEEEWRGLGITQSLGWEHYEVHEPEPHILLFKEAQVASPSSSSIRPGLAHWSQKALTGEHTTLSNMSTDLDTGQTILAQTDRLYLRPSKESDLEDYYAIFSDPRALKWA
ncbi:MAG: Cyclin-dependent kinases regulatory subunit (Cell division control protein cks1) [Pycnora praestabilis]|nr:MAG: Cyclin-dependent kinases regulatory subunit (Cell division control protein cks1) [Pycnora praestabilis]